MRFCNVQKRMIAEAFLLGKVPLHIRKVSLTALALEFQIRG